MKRLTAYLLTLLLTLVAMAQGTEADSAETALPTDVYAYYVVITPGTSVGTVLGHAAVRMSCPSVGLDYCFTIKTPEIKDEAFDIVFGNLRIGVVPEETAQFRADYIKDGRGITEYRLDLTIDEARRLWQMLDMQVERGLYLRLDYVNNSCTQVAFSNLYDLLSERKGLNLDSIIRTAIPVDTRRKAVFPYMNQDTWTGLAIHSLYAGSPDLEVQPHQLVVMPEDGAKVLERAGLVAERTEVSPSAIQVAESWFTPFRASVLFLLLCLLPFKSLDRVLLPLQVLLLLLFCSLMLFAHAPGMEWNWLICALFPPTAPLGLCYMLCHIGDIYAASQLLFVTGFFVRTIYIIMRKHQLKNSNINLLKKQKQR